MATFAISLAVGLASRVMISLLTPTKKVEGQRLDDLAAPKSQYGSGIPKVYGRARIEGCNLFWSPPLTEVKETESSGKGGGVETTNYSYYGNFAMLVCDGGANGVNRINRIWANGKLIYNADPTAGSETQQAAAQFLADHLEIYYGTSTQNPSPTIQSFEGIDNTPAFRGFCYLVFRDLPLEDYGNRIPKIDVEVFDTSYSPPLYQIVDDVCKRAGLTPSEFETLELDPTIAGAVLTQDGSSAKQFLEDLQRIYFFLGRETGSKIEFIMQRRPGTSATLTKTDLGVREYGSDAVPLYKEIRSQELEIPTEVQVEYKNINNDYNPGFQYARATKNHENEVNLRTSLVMSDSEALTAAQKLIQHLWVQRKRYEEVSLLPKWIGISPGDIIDLPVRSTSIPVQVQQVDIGANLQVSLKGVAYDAIIEDLSVDARTDFDYSPQYDVAYYGDAEAIPLDIALIDDDDEQIGIYLATTSEFAWKGGTIYYKEGAGEYLAAATVASLCASGTASPSSLTNAALPSRSHFIRDRVSKLIVKLDNGSLTSIPEQDFLNLKQLALVGNELVAIKNATLIGANTYECTELLRGCRGTEAFISGHVLNERFILMTSTSMLRFPGGTSQIGKTYSFKAVPAGRAITTVDLENTVTIQGGSLKPYAPCNPSITKQQSDGSLIVSWDRRARIDGGWRDYTDVPLDETIEQYELKILNGSTTVRTLTLYSPIYTYTLSQQTSDFGSARTSLSFDVRQFSTNVGFGQTLQARNISISKVIP